MTTVEELHEISIPSARDEPQAYLRALLELADGVDALEALATTPVTARRLCAQLSMEQLDRQPAAGEWAAADIVGHLFDVDVVYGFRWRLVLTEDDAAYPGYDEQLWT